MVKEKTRQCIVTRDCLLKDEMLRFVLDPNDEVIPDIRCKLPGRGVWIKDSRELVEKAIAQKAFARGFKKPVSAMKDLSGLILGLLQKDCLSALSLAYRAGDVIIGSAKILDAIDKKPVMFILHASGAAEDGCRRLDKKFSAANDQGDVTSNSLSLFSCDQLSSALGQPKVVHIGLKTGSAASRFLRLVKKIERYQNDNVMI